MPDSLASAQTFGGTWSDTKVSRLREYLVAYLTALKKQPFTLLYVDAFAGSGWRRFAHKDSDSKQTSLIEPPAEVVAQGSALMALQLDPGFDRYLFIDKASQNLGSLRREIARSSASDRVQLEQGDANQVLAAMCRDTNWSATRAVVFLDPFGMSVRWSTIEALAATKAVDLWWLIPTGLGMLRMMPNDSPPPPAWAAVLDAVLGDGSWRDFYRPSPARLPLADTSGERVQRHAGIDQIELYCLSRLSTAFPHVCPRGLRLGDGNRAFYYLAFAAANKEGGKIAVKIASSLLRSDNEREHAQWRRGARSSGRTPRGTR